VHAPTEDKNDDTNECFYAQLERVFDKFPKYHIKIAKLGSDDIFKPPIGSESLHEISSGSGVRVVNIASSQVKGPTIATFLNTLKTFPGGKHTTS
jgi:hypothetical protein